MNIYGICGITLLALVLCAVLKAQNSPVSVYLSTFAALLVYTASIVALKPLAEYLREIVNKVDGQLIELAFKAVGGAVLVQFLVLLCNEHGERSLGAALETGGAVAIFLLSFPVLKELIDGITALL